MYVCVCVCVCVCVYVCVYLAYREINNMLIHFL